jgi:uncharacterized protein YgfB (UPF0149 family)
MLNFNDGMSINTDGELRTIKKSDGLYIVGKGMCIPVNDYDEANEIINDMKSESQLGVDTDYPHETQD